MKKCLAAALFLAFPVLISAQVYPRNYFILPLDAPYFLSGTFGEIRSNHLHSGIDLSTDGDEGLPVMAAADGYVSRVKISADGYGKALYVTHPNGYVTVYAHLQKFTSAVNALVRKLQYEKQEFELDVTLKAGEYPDRPIEGHQWLLNRGIYNLENLDLSRLAADRVYEFAFIFAPMKLVGATGAPGNPIAVR
jgi:hypothetical protein